MHIKKKQEPELTKIHVSRTFSREALRDAFDRATNAALSVFTQNFDLDRPHESVMLDHMSPEQFFNMDTTGREKLLGKVQTAIDEGRFEDAEDLLVDSMDLFNKNTMDDFKALAYRAGQIFEESLKASLGHVRLEDGDDFNSWMVQAAEEGGQLVEEGLRQSFMGGGGALQQLTQVAKDAVHGLLTDERREAYSTKSQQEAALRGEDTRPTDKDEEIDETLAAVTGNLYDDIATFVNRATLEDSETMGALRVVADSMSGRVEDILKTRVDGRSLRIEYDVWLTSPQEEETGGLALGLMELQPSDSSDGSSADSAGADVTDAAGEELSQEQFAYVPLVVDWSRMAKNTYTQQATLLSGTQLSGMLFKNLA